MIANVIYAILFVGLPLMFVGGYIYTYIRNKRMYEAE